MRFYYHGIFLSLKRRHWSLSSARVCTGDSSHYCWNGRKGSMIGGYSDLGSTTYTWEALGYQQSPFLQPLCAHLGAKARQTFPRHLLDSRTWGRFRVWASRPRSHGSSGSWTWRCTSRGSWDLIRFVPQSETPSRPTGWLCEGRSSDAPYPTSRCMLTCFP